MTDGIVLRDAGPGDAETLAALHAASWRSAYRGILRDAYLDGALDDDRRAFWRHRMEDPAPGRIILLAEHGGEPVGFGCVLGGAHPRWGSLVDNLHAHPTSRGRGVGRTLMRAMAGRAAVLSPGQPLHLFCLEANRAARGFYERLGGAVVDRDVRDEPDGCRHPCLRYAWPAPAELAAALG